MTDSESKVSNVKFLTKSNSNNTLRYKINYLLRINDEIPESETEMFLLFLP